MNNIKLVHSLHYLNTNNYSLCEKTFNIVDSNNNLLCGLLNIPKNKSLYKIDLIKTNNIFNNLKIEIELNYDKLFTLILYNNNIPYKKELIKLLKKKYIKNFNQFTSYEDILYNDILNLSNNNNIYIKKNIIKINDIIVDTLNEKFYILNNENRKLFFIKDKNLNGIFLSKPNKNIISQLCSNNLLNFIFSKKINLIISDKTNINFLNSIPNLIIITKESQINKHLNNFKFIVINESFYNKKYELINSINWNSIILLNIIPKNLESNYINLKSLNKFIFYNSLEYYNFKPKQFELLKVIVNKDICFYNIYNLEKLKNNIFFIDQPDINVSKKEFKLEKFDIDFLNELDIIYHNIFYSLKENYMYYSLIDFNKFKQNDYLYSKIYENNKYLNPECAICLEKISKKSLLYTKCNHYFCEVCIIRFFKLHKKNCPLCRTEIDSKSLLKIRYSKETQYVSDKLKYLLSLKKSNILIISYFEKSIETLQHILSNFKNNTSYTLVHIDNIYKLHNVKHINFDKIIFLENTIPHCQYYLYYLNNFDSIKLKNIQLLSIKNNNQIIR